MAKSVNSWMSWQDGVDLIAATSPNLKAPNIIVHLGKHVTTPAGSAAAGVILWRPDPSNIPAIKAFVSPDDAVGKYFGPALFAGTPFENAPALKAAINIQVFNNKAVARCDVAGYHFEVEMSDFSSPYMINRPPDAALPFWQQGIEMTCAKTILQVNGHVIDIISSSIGTPLGLANVVAPSGIYAR